MKCASGQRPQKSTLTLSNISCIKYSAYIVEKMIDTTVACGQADFVTLVLIKSVVTVTRL